MANTAKPQATPPGSKPPPAPPPALHSDRKRQIIIGLGYILGIAGILIVTSIVSYVFYAWQLDQAVLGPSIGNTSRDVHNWAGPVGAYIANALVRYGAGIASLSIGVAIINIAYHIIKEHKKIPIFRNMRWVSITLLLISPTIACVWGSNNNFLDGALGKWIYNDLLYSNVGNMAGVIMLAAWLFFLFVVLAIDFMPQLKQLSAYMAQKMEEARERRAAAIARQEALAAEEALKAAQAEAEEAQRQAELEAQHQAEEDPNEPTEDLDEAYNGNVYTAVPYSNRNALREESDEEDLTPVEEVDEHGNSYEDPPWDPAYEPQLASAEEVPLPPPIPTENLTTVPNSTTSPRQMPMTIVDTRKPDEPYIAPQPAPPPVVVPPVVITPPPPPVPPQVVIAPPPVPPVTQIAVPPMMVKPPAPPPPPAPEAIAQQTELNITPPPQNGNITLKHGTHISISSGEPYAPELDLPDYRFPTLDLLEKRSTGAVAALDKEELEHNKNQIIQTLSSFNIEIQSISATIGPTVTLYEIVPAKGVKISKIKNLEDDIALNLAALGIRIIAPIPGKGTIGIEVPNANKMMVPMLELLASDKFVNNKMSLPIALGKKIDNENYIVDLATMPHLLMAGATGQGKSVGINTILVSLLYKKHPAQLKFVMIDPKKVELSVYRLIEEHFLAKLPNEEDAIITDIRKVIYTLTSLCVEMDDRYDLLKAAGARNIKEYNEKFIARKLNPENGHKYLPFIVLVIDEFADLIMTAGKEVEMPIARLAQLARAVGIHLIIATQRPSVNVITGIIKANFPARVAFKVSSKVDSRTILDTAGAEQLVGRGDMLISFGSEILRLQCAFVDTPEVERIVEFIAHQRGYPTAFMLPEIEMNDEDSAPKDFDPKKRDKLFEECARLVVQTQSGSTSNLQRRFNIGYNRAGRIMDELEAASIVGPAVGSKPRDVFISTEAELQQLFDTFM